MYGGLQTGYGVFCLLGALRADLYRPALISLVLMIGSLALARLYSTVTGGGPGGRLHLRRHGLRICHSNPGGDCPAQA